MNTTDAAVRAELAKLRADRARQQIRPYCGPGKPAALPHLPEPPTCTVCGGTMALLEPGQTTHPGCDPDAQPEPEPEDQPA